MRLDKGRLIAALVHRLGSFQLAEDALQEACASALVHWVRDGLPHSSQGWLIRVAFRKALDQLRSEGRAAERETALHLVNALLGPDTPETIPDERLRLIFTSCHPALELKSRVALTLRTVCGVSTGEIARLFLDNEATMGQRLSRAKNKIAQAGIAFAVPEPDQWDDRLQAVLTTLYLIFTTGYTAGDQTRSHDLCEEAVFLGRLLLNLCPAQPEIEGALALMLLTDARRPARVDADGVMVPPAEQDRGRWDANKWAEGQQLLETALHRKRAGPFQIKAAISACHMVTRAPDWPQILALYTVLLTMEPTPVVRVNHAVALAQNGRLPAARATLASLEKSLTRFQPYYAALAFVMAQSGEKTQARQAYVQAIALSSSHSEQQFLSRKLQALDSP